MRAASLLLVPLLFLLPAAPAAAEDVAFLRGKDLPKGKALVKLVEGYLDAEVTARRALRKQWDREFAHLDPKDLPKLRKTLLKIALKHGPKLQKKGNNWFFEKGRGRYIVSGSPKKGLWLGLHGGGVGSGDAGSAASAMGGGGFGWIFPEVLKKTERGWTDAGTEEFVLELIQAAKRTWKLDPNRIYITGHSMGGYGTWTIGSRHADVFAGLAPYAGAPSCVTMQGQSEASMVEPGVLPNLFNVPLHFFQSGDDKNVPPESNDLAARLLKELKAEHPRGFNYRYDRVDGRGHAAPKEGYGPSQKWIASHDRVPRPKKFLWQPTLSWKRHFYWAYWPYAEMETILQFEAKDGNRIEVTTLEGSDDLEGLSILLGTPLVDPTKPVTVVVNGEARKPITVPRTFSTLMLTLPRLDPHLLFDARLDL
ncbi:MAG: prolyl oligopeptidase family serine peptidase [Planctomycetota bacterium]|nr:prolyl oligopeptidase family serine peptidase [Planctomycetota bacterium]